MEEGDLMKVLENRGRLPGSTRLLLGSWYFLSIFVSYISLFFSTSIILDLYFVLKNPFNSTEARIKRMTTFTILMALALSSGGLILTLAKDPDWAVYNVWLFIVISICNIALGIVIMVFVVVTFRKKGMSKEIKKSIQKRYLEFIVVYSLLEGPFIFFSMPDLDYKADKHLYSGMTTYINSWYAFAVTLFGFGIAISRMRDKILRVKLNNIWFHCTCRRYRKTSYEEFDKIVEESQMNTFLKTSLNTELVITILKGILILAASSSDKIDHMDDQDMYRIK